MLNLNVLISGSGVAGSVFAFWLLRAYPNADITIVERDAALRLTGASVDIRSSAVDIIKWMGLEQEIRAQTTKEEGVQMVDTNGKEVFTFKTTGSSDVQSITSEYEIFRGALAKIFIDPILTKVTLLLGETIEGYEHCDDGVVVTFTNSKEVKKYDLLVGADGLRSKIRSKLLEGKRLADPQPNQLYNDGIYAAYFTVKSDLLKGSLIAKGFTAPGGRVIYLRPDPSGATRANLIVVTAKRDDEMRQRLNTALREGNETYMTLMEELFQNIGWIVPDVIRGMRQSDDFYCSIFAEVRCPTIQDNRVVLLGDAGYATPGFGTSLAIIGGYVLAGELLNNPGNIDKALERYEGVLLPFVKNSQGNGDFAMRLFNPQTQLGINIRNGLLWFVARSRLDRVAMYGAAKMGFTEKKVVMPDYLWPATE